MKLLSSNFLWYYTVYYTVQCGSSSLQCLLLVFYFLVCGWNPIVWPFKWKLLSSTFLWYWVVLSCCAQPWICPFSLKVAAYNLDTFEWRSALGKSEKSTSSCGLFSYNCTACSTFQYHWSYISFYFSLSAKGNLAVAMVLVMTSIWHHWLIILKNSPSRDQVPTTILILSNMRWEWVDKRLIFFYQFTVTVHPFVLL